MCNFCSGPFWTHKITFKAKHNCIQTSLHLLSAAGSIPHVEPIPASLVVASSESFSFVSNHKLN